jgi:hypothetical protein
MVLRSSANSRGDQSAPRVFISSTAEDLEDYRAAARDTALRTRFFPDMQEYSEAKDNRPYWECMERVAGTHVLVVIVAHRYACSCLSCAWPR